MSSDAGAPGLDLEPPIRAVVLGSSHAVLVRPRRTGGGGTYAECLIDELAARGLAADVTNEGRWFEMVDHIYGRWEGAVAPRMPHVVVIHVGFVECQPWVVPHRLHRWVLRWNASLHPARSLGRRVVAGPAVRLMRWWTPTWSRMVGLRVWKQSPARFQAELARLIDTTRKELGALVLVVGMAPRAGSWLHQLMPDLDERMRRYDDILRAVVEERGDRGTVLVDIRTLHDELADDAAPDGMHLSPTAPARLASLLADEVVAWRKDAAA